MLDDNIRYWRDQRDAAESNQDDTHYVLAVNFIDAYQDVRVKIFDEVLENA